MTHPLTPAAACALALQLVAAGAVAAADPAAGPSPPASQPTKSVHTVAVLALKPASVAVAEEVKLESAALVDALRATQTDSKVLSLDDVKALLEVKASQQLMGCDDARCAMDVSNALAADVIVAGTAGSLAGARHVFVTLLDGKQGRVMGRASHSWKDEDLRGAMKRVATLAFSPDAIENGDQALTELRTAVVVDEFDSNGRTRAVGQVGACLQGDLAQRGVPVVSADRVKAIRAQLAGDATGGGLLLGAPLDVLDTGAADVILRATVHMTEAGKYHTNTSMRASLSFELVKVDTGEVLTAGAMSAIDRAPSVEGASELARKRVCAQVQPELAKALELRIERGTRVVVEVTGAVTPEHAQRVQRELEAVKPLVARVKLRKIDKKGAVLDVTLRGGDATALGFVLSKGQDMRVSSVSSSALTLKD